MMDGPDPLGKRALYWMPVEPEAVAEAELGSKAGVGLGPAPLDGSSPFGDRDSVGEEVRHARPAGKHALFSDATPAGEPARDRASALSEDPLPPRGILSVACSRCGSVTRVGVVEFLVLQLPFWAWRPRGAFDRWMTCPACRRRAWMSVTIAR